MNQKWKSLFGDTKPLDPLDPLDRIAKANENMLKTVVKVLAVAVILLAVLFYTTMR